MALPGGIIPNRREGSCQPASPTRLAMWSIDTLWPSAAKGHSFNKWSKLCFHKTAIVLVAQTFEATNCRSSDKDGDKIGTLGRRDEYSADTMCWNLLLQPSNHYNNPRSMILLMTKLKDLNDDWKLNHTVASKRMNTEVRLRAL